MMNQKLTLQFDANTIERAKKLARNRKTSLSKMVKELLQDELNKNISIDVLPTAPPIIRAKGKKPNHLSDKEIKDLKNNILVKKHYGNQ